MELPLGGPALRHYTQSRPRPHRQKLNYRPSRPQETIIESENEDFELMGRVDEGVEEFFTKKVLPAETLIKEDEEEESITVHEVPPASAVPCPPPTKTLRRKLGDFFTLKKRRGLKSETSQEGRPKKASIADFIRPLREVARTEKDKDKDKVKEHEKENEKEKGKDSTDSGEAVQGISVSGAPPMRGEAVPPRRALREGKSQSLILLSESASGATRNKKQLDGQNSFEQKLHLMLQRIGVSKPQSEETQNQEGEMKKAESEGTIIDSKPEPPPTKPRTMSASSDTRHQLRPSVSAHESAGKPPLLPKPVIKPAPPATTSGRNTPENELGQIAEGEPNTPTKKDPAPVPSPPAQAVGAAPALSVATISDTAPDSSTVLHLSAIIPTDTDICTDSVNLNAEATAPTNVTEPDSTASMPEASPIMTTELAAPTLQRALTSPTSPPSSSPEPITPSPLVTSNSTITTPSFTTVETVTPPCNDNSTTPTDLSTKLTLSEANGTVSISAVDAVSSTFTSISNIPAGLSENVVTAASDDLASCTLTTTTTATKATTLSLDVKTTSEAPNVSDILSTVTLTISSDATNITSSSSTTMIPCGLPITTSTICTSATTPAFTTCTMSPSTVTHTSIVIQDPTPVPSITSHTTQVTDTSQTTTTVNSLFLATSDMTTRTALSPVHADVSAAEDLSATSHCLSTTETSDEHSGRENELQTSPQERSLVDTTIKGVDDVLEVVQKSALPMTAESKTQSESEKECENKVEVPTLVISEVIMKDNEEKHNEEQINEVEVADAEAEAATGASDELSRDEVVNVDQKQQETKSSDEK